MRFALLEQFYNSPEYRNRVMARMEVLKTCEEEPLNITRLALERWSVDPIEFIEQFGWVMIPEFNNQVKPFFLFPYQKKIITKLWEAELSGHDNEILIDKPCGMGLTWILVWYQVWRWLFTPNWSGFNLSRSESEVDDGSSDSGSSIFGKYRWAIAHLPAWLLPEGFVPKGKKGTPTDMMLRISNPQLSSSLVGSSTNQNADRSRRYGFIFVDECFSIEHFQSVYRSIQSVARTKVFVSTVKAGRVYQEFKNLCQEAGNYISLTWKDHPFKDQIWYEEQLKKAEFDPEVMKEVDVDYAVNIKSQYYPEIRQAKSLPDIPYNRDKPLYIGLDFGGQQDFTAMVWAQYDGGYLNVIESMSNTRKTLDWYIPFLNPGVIENPEHYTPFQRDLLKKIQTWSKPVAYFGEVAHFQKQMPTNRSIADELVRYGIKLMCNNYAVGHVPRRHATVQMLPHTIFNFGSDGVTELYDAIATSRYSDANRGVSKESHIKPVHDPKIADLRSCFENLAVNIPRIFRNQRKEMAGQTENKQFANTLIKYLKI